MLICHTSHCTHSHSYVRGTYHARTTCYSLSGTHTLKRDETKSVRASSFGCTPKKSLTLCFCFFILFVLHFLSLCVFSRTFRKSLPRSLIFTLAHPVGHRHRFDRGWRYAASFGIRFLKPAANRKCFCFFSSLDLCAPVAPPQPSELLIYTGASDSDQFF